MKTKKIIFVTGLSGSGKTITLNTFEDVGYFCIDNMPLSLLEKFLELIEYTSHIKNVAISCDIRDLNIKENLKQARLILKKHNIEHGIIFLETNDNTLIKRYSQTRRIHPLSLLSNINLKDAIEQEKNIMNDIKIISNIIIDTSNLDPNELRRVIISRFSENLEKKFIIQLISFGFKYGIPLESDNIFDVRFIPNPFFVESLKNKTGLDEQTKDYVMQQKETKLFLNNVESLLLNILPLYKHESKSYLTIAIGCTGGRHRSVVLVEYLKNFIKSMGFNVNITHKDINK